jgi:hypothetical protein
MRIGCAPVVLFTVENSVPDLSEDAVEGSVSSLCEDSFRRGYVLFMSSGTGTCSLMDDDV